MPTEPKTLKVKPARGRRPDPAKEEAILDAARELFLEFGYGANIDDIAERAGVVKQTIYARFKSKDELFAATVRASAEELVAPLKAGTAPGRPREALIAFGEQYHRIVLEPRRILMQRLMIGEATKFPDLARRYYEAGPCYVRGRLANWLNEMTGAGALRIEDAEIAASQFLGLIKGVEHLGALLGVGAAEDELQMRRRIASSVDAFLRIYRPEP